jgi:hypothetical protein
MEATKQCCRCLETKPLAAFNLKPQAACKACINLYQVVYRERNRERIREKARIYSRAKQEERREYLTNYRNTHREKLNASQRVYSSSEERKIKDREYAAKRNEELTDGDVRHALSRNTTLKKENIPPEIVEAKRLQIKIRRAIENGYDTRGQGQEAGQGHP